MTDPTTPLPERVAALVALMRSDPEAAMQAAQQVKIMSAREIGRHWMERSAIGKSSFTVYTDDGDDWDIELLGMVGVVKPEPHETEAAFRDKVDAALIADGWILL